MKLKLNVYPVMPDMDDKLREIIQKAVDNRAKMVEIAYGEAGDNIKKHILHFLNKKDIRKLYSRLEKTGKGWGRIYLHFRWED
jgi:hypothetical protein